MKPAFLSRLDPYLLLTLLISALAALPLLGPYFVGSHDGILAVYRFFEFDRSIQDGVLVPRWAPDLFFGYGYPFFNFYAPLSYYVAEVFHQLGAGFVGSISAAFALGFVLSGLAMYLLARDLGGRWAGALAGLAYVFAPYHLVNAHLRGDLAEFFAFVWFPAILWAAGRMVSRLSLGYLALTSLLYGALLTTHNIMALAFSPLLAAYVVFLLWRSRRKPSPGRRAVYSAIAILLAFGLTAFFWMPALQQVKDIQIDRLDHDPSFYYKTSLMQVSGYVSDALLQDYGPRSAGGDYGYPVELGLAQVVMAAAAAGLVIWKRRRGQSEVFATVVFLAVAGLAYYAIMFPWSLPLWENVPLMSYLQSPWRLLPFLILFTSVLIGYLGRWASGLKPAQAGASLALIALLATLPNVINLQPRYVDLVESNISVTGILRFETLSQNIGMTAAAEYLPKGVRSKMTSSPLALEAISKGTPPEPFDAGFLANGAEAQTVERRTTLGRFRVKSGAGTPFLFNQTYFPGWAVYLDGREVTPKGVGTANLMAVDVPAGEHELEFRFEDTRIRLLGIAISLSSIVCVLGILAFALDRRRRAQARSGTTEHHQAQPGTATYTRPLPGAYALGGLALVAVLSAATLVPGLATPASNTPFPVEAAWRGGPSLQGYNLSSSTVRPGENLEIALHWSLPPEGLSLRLGLKGHTGKVWTQETAEGTSNDERAGGRQVHRLSIPKDTPPGMYQISLDVLSGGKPMPLQGERLARVIFPEKSMLLGPVLVVRPAPGTQVASSAIPISKEVALEGKVALLGYKLEGKERSLDLTTYWKALSIMREDYSVFAHLENVDGKALTKNDLQPWANPYPTTLWLPGDVVAVPFHFDLPAGFLAEDHRIGLGLYTPDNFRRLSVLDAAGHPVTNTIFLSLRP